MIMMGRKITVLVRVLNSSTGSTALFFTEFFLKMSYTPRKRAEITANITHIEFKIKEAA
jgi:hypothetical protein